MSGRDGKQNRPFSSHKHKKLNLLVAIHHRTPHNTQYDTPHNNAMTAIITDLGDMYQYHTVIAEIGGREGVDKGKKELGGNHSIPPILAWSPFPRQPWPTHWQQLPLGSNPNAKPHSLRVGSTNHDHAQKINNPSPNTNQYPLNTQHNPYPFSNHHLELKQTYISKQILGGDEGDGLGSILQYWLFSESLFSFTHNNIYYLYQLYLNVYPFPIPTNTIQCPDTV